jgi:predicted metal-dependent peptidase
MTPVVLDQKAADMVTKAVAAIVLEDPFYGYLLLRQAMVQDPEISTCGTNGLRIRYNPKFIRKQSIAQLKGLFKHEVMHVAHMHHLRRGRRDPEKWNQAGDYSINGILKEAGVSLPDNGLFNDAWKDFGTEHIYNLIPDDDGSGGGGTSIFKVWNFGGVEDAPGSEDPTTREAMEQDTRQDVLQAINAAKIMGKMPAGLERLVNSIRESRMPWRQILARFFRATAKGDYTWLRPHRRWLPYDIILPSLHSDALGPLVIGIDTSGSIAGAELESFFGCINGILKQTKPESIHIVYCDAEVANTQTFKPTDYPINANKFKPGGGGGTDFRPVFNYVDEKRLRPCAVLYLTDMMGTFPDKAPKYPVIWCATTESKAPWGKTIEIKN